MPIMIVAGFRCMPENKNDWEITEQSLTRNKMRKMIALIVEHFVVLLNNVESCICMYFALVLIRAVLLLHSMLFIMRQLHAKQIEKQNMGRCSRFIIWC